MNYLRMCWYYLVVYNPEIDGGQYKLTGWQILRADDGPIHTVWVWWGRLTCNWFTVGWHCWRHGHDWREQTITYGRVRWWTETSPKVRHYVKSCSYCGKYNGHGMEPYE